MIPFKTSKEQKKQIPELLSKMLSAGLPESFVLSIGRLSEFDEGIFDLVSLWNNDSLSDEEQKEIVKDLQDLLKDYYRC